MTFSSYLLKHLYWCPFEISVVLSWKYSDTSMWRKRQVWQLLCHLQQLYGECAFMNAQTQCNTNQFKDESTAIQDKNNYNIMHIPSFTVRYTAVNVSKPGLSTAHQYLPASDRWSGLKVTLKTPLPESTNLILSASALPPDFTVTRMSSLVLHGSLQKYLLFFHAKLCEHWKESTPHSNPSTWISAPSVHVAAKMTSWIRS